jgi:hypothetical protein
MTPHEYNTILAVVLIGLVIGRHRTCPKFVEPGTVQVLLTEEQYKCLENLPPATKKDIEEARKKLESAPDSTK